LFLNNNISEKQIVKLIEKLLNSKVTKILGRRVRLFCLETSLNILSNKNPKLLTAEILHQILGESLVFIKDTNVKIRELASSLLLSLAKHYKIRSKFACLINQIIAGLACSEPYFQSGSITALNRIIYEHSVDVIIIRNYQKLFTLNLY